jgi:hypothetical protein
MQSLPKHKRGDTFSFEVSLNGTVWDGAAVGELKSQIRDLADTLVADLIVTVTETPGTFRFKAADTSNWPIGTVVTDIQRTAPDGTITSSETLKIPVIKDVTHHE